MLIDVDHAVLAMMIGMSFAIMGVFWSEWVLSRDREKEEKKEKS